MTETLSKILETTLERLHALVIAHLPATLAAIVLILGGWGLAAGVRWVLYRIFKGLTIDKFLRQSGLAFMIDRSGRLRATRLVAELAFWAILLAGGLLGVSAFNTEMSNRLVQGFVLLLPKLLTAGLILLGGAWVGQYLGRSLLVWAVNEGIPSPRRLAAAARILITFVAVVVAADHLEFARNVFLAAFILLVGGLVLAVSLAAGLGGSKAVERFLVERKETPEGAGERSTWSHL